MIIKVNLCLLCVSLFVSNSGRCLDSDEINDKYYRTELISLKEKKIDSLSNEITNFYLDQYMNNELVLKKRRNGKGNTLSNIYFEENKLIGRFSKRLELLACFTNKNVCSVYKSKKRAEAIHSLEEGISLYKNEIEIDFHWKNKATDLVFVPDYELEKKLRFVSILKKPNQTLDSLLQSTGGCSLLDGKCEDVVQFLNKKIYLMGLNNYSGPIILPGIELAIYGNKEKNDSHVKLINDVDVLREINRLSNRLSREINRVPKSNNSRSSLRSSFEKFNNEVCIDKFVKAPENEEMVSLQYCNQLSPDFKVNIRKHLDENKYIEILNSIDNTSTKYSEALVEATEIDTKSIRNEVFSELQPMQFESFSKEIIFGVVENIADEQSGTSYPLFWDTEEVLENEYQLNNLVSFPIDTKFRRLKKTKIWMFDGWIDKTHCFLKNIKTNNFKVIDGSLLIQNKTCGTEFQTRNVNSKANHATHVAGIIGADSNGMNVSGLNSQSEITSHQILQKNKMRESMQEKMQDKILESTDNFTTPDIVNVSFGYLYQEQGKNINRNSIKTGEPFEDIISTLPNILYVVSAGNNKSDYSSLCPRIPACLSFLPNVISVVGLSNSDTKVELWSHSNYSSSFHIGAYAENILSTIANDGVAKMSGTSQAAPQVTAGASLLLSDNPKLDPIEIKNRLIYTSDLYPAITDKIFGGKLNIENSLKNKCDQIELKDGRKIYGTVKGVYDGEGKNTGYFEFRDRREADATSKSNPVNYYNENEKILRLDYKNVRRMKYYENEGLYIVFYVKSLSKGDDQKLLRLDKLDLKNGNNNPVKIIDCESNKEILPRVKTPDIVDFISHYRQ